MTCYKITAAAHCIVSVGLCFKEVLSPAVEGKKGLRVDTCIRTSRNAHKANVYTTSHERRLRISNVL